MIVVRNYFAWDCAQMMMAHLLPTHLLVVVSVHIIFMVFFSQTHHYGFDFSSYDIYCAWCILGQQFLSQCFLSQVSSQTYVARMQIKKKSK